MAESRVSGCLSGVQAATQAVSNPLAYSALYLTPLCGPCQTLLTRSLRPVIITKTEMMTHIYNLEFVGVSHMQKYLRVSDLSDLEEDDVA